MAVAKADDSHDAECETEEGEDAAAEEAEVKHFTGSFLRLLEGFGKFFGIDGVAGFDSLDEYLRAFVVAVHYGCEHYHDDSDGEDAADADGY